MRRARRAPRRAPLAFAAALALAGALAVPAATAGQAPQEGSSVIGVSGTTVPGPTAANDTALDRRTREVASQLRCPVCQGMSIQDSPSELAQQMRRLVQEQLAAGRTPEQVKAYFVEKYGEWILLRPKAHGFNLVVYVLPWVALLIGVGVIVLAVRRWTATQGAEAAEAGDAAEAASPHETISQGRSRA